MEVNSPIKVGSDQLFQQPNIALQSRCRHSGAHGRTERFYVCTFRPDRTAKYHITVNDHSK